METTTCFLVWGNIFLGIGSNFFVRLQMAHFAAVVDGVGVGEGKVGILVFARDDFAQGVREVTNEEGGCNFVVGRCNDKCGHHDQDPDQAESNPHLL